MTSLHSFNFILVEPVYDENLGSCARVLKNFGFSNLILVNPKADPTSDISKSRALLAKDILENSKQTKNLKGALQDCHLVFGTSGKRRKENQNFLTLEEAASLIASKIGQKIAFIFGPEDRGLSNKEISLCNYLIHIPTSPGFPSLNLSHAVGLVAYQLSLALNLSEIYLDHSKKAIKGGGQSNPGPILGDFKKTPATIGQRQQFMVLLEKLKEQLEGSLTVDTHTVHLLLSRFSPSENELGFLQSVIKKILRLLPCFLFLSLFSFNGFADDIVTRIYDGDTIRVGTNKIRLIGINAPEKEWKEKGITKECYSNEAREYLAKQLMGFEVKLTYDPIVGRTDKYGRRLAYVYLGKRLLNAEMITQGLARFYPYFHFEKWNYFEKLEKEAQKNHRGLWEGCKP